MYLYIQYVKCKTTIIWEITPSIDPFKDPFLRKMEGKKGFPS